MRSPDTDADDLGEQDALETTSHAASETTREAPDAGDELAPDSEPADADAEDDAERLANDEPAADTDEAADTDDEEDDEPEDDVDEPSPREWSALARLRSSTNWVDRLHALSDLLRDVPKVAYAAFNPPFSDHVEVDDPDLRCFLIAKELSKRLNGRVPPVLAPFLERRDLDPRSRSRLESALAEHVEAWVGVPVGGRARSLRLEFLLSRSSEGGVVTSVQVRVSSLRLGDEARTGSQLRLLLAESRREPGLLAAEQLELLELLLEPLVAHCLGENDNRFVLTGSALLRVLLAVDDSRLVSWGETLDPELAEIAGVDSTQPLRLARGTIDIGPVLRNTDAGPRVVLEHRLPNGEVLGPERGLVLRGPAGMKREPTLVLTGGEFWIARGDPPAPLPELFAAAGGFDPARAQSRPLLEAMARSFTELRDSLATHSRVHPVRPAVCLDLRDDDWLQLRAFASAVPGWRPGDPSEPGAPIFEWMPDGRWLSLDANAEGEDTTNTADTARLMALRLGLAVEDAADGAAAAGAEAAGGGEPDASDALGTDAASAEAGPDAPGESDADALAAGAPADTDTSDTESDSDLDPDDAAPIWLEFPEPARVAPVVGWLESMGAASGAQPRRGSGQPDAVDRGVGGWIRLSSRSADRFAEAWDARPEGVAWYGNEAARQLIEAPAPLSPKLRVESSGVSWFSISAEWEAEGAMLSEADLATLRNADSRFVRLASGWTSRAQVEAFDATAEWLAELGVEAGGDPARVSLWQLAQARPEAIAFLEQLGGSSEAREKLLELRTKIASFDGLPRIEVPKLIEGTMRPYQREGLDFLVHAAELDLGVILADDMGLGKTLQALAWVARLIEEDREGGPTLVVCPASVTHNWEREVARFAPSLKVLVLAAGEARHAMRAQIPDHDIVLTNYSLMRRDAEELADIEWRAVILDEAQNIKNPDAAVSKAARSLQARHRLALTGTPLENRALDLWSILAFLNPGYLGPRAPFVRRYDRGDAPPHARTLLASKLRPVLLRRLKAQVAPELPPRIEEQRDCELSEGQRKLYLAELNRGRELIAKLSEDGGVSQHRISILAVLTRLRQICCHPALAGGHADLGSGKFDAFFELLEPLRAEGHKVLVFSQFVECLKLVAGELESRDIGYHMLTGSSRNRGDIVSAFEDDPNPAPFLISLKAGGTGLNLTAANYVVLFDPWWNPAVEAQAIDRTHRIGQDRTVIAYRMVSQGTIEERIRELQDRKASLARDVLGEDGFAKALSRDDLDFLFADVGGDDDGE